MKFGNESTDFCVALEKDSGAMSNPGMRKVILVSIDHCSSMRFDQYCLEDVTRMFAPLLKV
jgi:ATP-dependent Clp protease adapter protein ClpS